MSKGPKAAHMGRREFLQVAGTGLLGSMITTRTANALHRDEVTFTSEGFSLSLHFSNGTSAQLGSLRNPRTGFEWAREGSAFEVVFTTGEKKPLNWMSSAGAQTREAVGDRFTFNSHSKDAGVIASMALQHFSQSPILEFQVEFHNISNKPLTTVTAFGPFRFALRDNLGPLQVHAIRRNEYGLETIPVNGSVSLSGGKWNAPAYGGLLLLEAVGTGEFLLVGIEWERGWRYRVEKDNAGTWLSIEVADLSYDLAADERITTPRIFLGLSHGGVDQAFLDARHYMQKNVFPPPLKNWPWVVYDFWATEAEGVEKALLQEVEFAARLGVDVFNLDAAWYTGSSKKGKGDWGCGLGHYTDDREKYPSGLASISKSIHDAGMKVGLWVGPNVVDSRIVGSLIPRHWIAQLDGKDQSLQPEGWESPVLQVCLGCREYIEFLKKELSRIVREFQLDWLKWDNSGIPASPAGCTRPDHGHQAGDGSYASLVGQYEIFNYLHTTFPDLVLEQCGYGSRLDYGLARTIRSNWLSDASFPSDRVRQNAIVASHLYPSAYNGAWIVSADPDLLHSANDSASLDTIYRSRMLSLFGFGTINGQLTERISLFPEPILVAARRNLDVYKRFRHLLQYPCFNLAPPRETASKPKQDQWEAVEFVSPTGDEAVILAFRGGSAQTSLRLPLKGVRSGERYELKFANTSVQHITMNGRDLLSKGIDLSLEHPHMSEIVSLQMI